MSKEGAFDPEDLGKALAFAVRLHGKQKRKLGGAPYVSHLLNVAGLVAQYGGRQDEVVAALLHDAVEDQGGLETRDEIEKRFGSHVADLVLAVSDSFEEPRPPWRERKEAFIRRLQESVSLEALRIVLCDKLDNLRSLVAAIRIGDDDTWKAMKGGREGTLWYHREVIRAAQTHQNSSEIQHLIEQCARTFAELEQLALSSPPIA